MSLFQPVGQKRLTNVAIVRLKTHGKRFEIACYRNKVLNWREGIEKDLNEVMQTDTIFSDVGRGAAAKEADLKKAFGTTKTDEICKRILKNGELQVSDKEREVYLEGIFRDIIQIVVEKCVHPDTGRQMTPLTVENALKRIGFSVKQDSAKKQALKAIEALCTELPESFTRAKMRLHITCSEAHAKEVRAYLAEEVVSATLEDERSTGSGFAFTFVCEPKAYRLIDEWCAKYASDGLTLQIMEGAVHDAASIVSSNVVTGSTAATGSSPAKPASSDVSDPAAPSRAVDEAADESERRRREGEGGGAAPPQEAHEGAAATQRTGGAVVSAQAGSKPSPAAAAGATAPAGKKSMKCSACSAEFQEAADYRAHCKSEWHNLNLKRKVKGLPPVSEEEFAEISLDAREGFLAMDA